MTDTPQKMMPRHKPEEIRTVLDAIEAGMSRKQAALEFSVSVWTIDSWQRRQKKLGIGSVLAKATRGKPGPKPKAPGAPELTALRQRIFDLEHEVRVLEKLVVSQALQLEHYKTSQK